MSLNNSFTSDSDISFNPEDVLDISFNSCDSFEEYEYAWPRQEMKYPPKKLMYTPPVRMPLPLSEEIIMSFETYKVKCAAALLLKQKADEEIAKITGELEKCDITSGPKWSRNSTKTSQADRLRREVDAATKVRDEREKEYNAIVSASTVTNDLVTSHAAFVEFVKEYEKLKAIWNE